MKTNAITKLCCATLSAFAIAIPAQPAQAFMFSRWTFPATSGKPYSQLNASSGLDFSSWFLAENQVQNSHSTQTRSWSVPIGGLQHVQVSDGSNTPFIGGGTRASLYSRCDSGSKARFRVYLANGSLHSFSNLINCSGINTAAFLGTSTATLFAGPYTANVEFQLGPSAMATAVEVEYIN